MFRRWHGSAPVNWVGAKGMKKTRQRYNGQFKEQISRRAGKGGIPQVTRDVGLKVEPVLRLGIAQTALSGSVETQGINALPAHQEPPKQRGR